MTCEISHVSLRGGLYVVGLGLLLTIIACGDGPDADNASEQSGDPGATDGAAAILAVGDRTYEFERIFCAFGPEETGQDDTEFSLSARQDGLQLDATISERFGHVVSVDDIENLDDPRVGWTAGGVLGGTEDIIELDGRQVSAEATFEDENTGETTEGSLRATCP